MYYSVQRRECVGKKFDQTILNYVNFIIRWRFVVIALSLLLVGVTGYGAGNLAFSTNYRVFFSESNPELRAFDNFQNTYTKNDNILFVVQPKDGKVFTRDVGAAIEDLTEQAWQIPFSIRVDSISNFQHTYAQYDKELDEDNLIVEDLLYQSETLSDKEMADKRQIGVDEPLLYGNLIARDVEATGVNVTLQYAEKSITEVPEAVGKAREIVADIQGKYPDLKIALTGVSMLNNAFAEAGMQDAGSLTPIMYLILIVIMVLTLRSLSATIATFFVIGFSFILALGLAGYAGILLTPISVMAPTVILTLAIADSIHILISMKSSMRDGMGKIDAIKDSMRINFLPVFITSLTTIVGFLTLNFLDSPPFHDLGNITAMGIVAAWFFSITFLPAFISILPMKVKVTKESTGLANMLDRYAGFIIARRKSVMAVSTIAAVVLIAMIPRIELNDQWIEYFDRSIQFRGDAEFGMEELTGVYLIEYSVEAAGTSGIHEPEYLENLEKFTNWLRAQPETEHVYSYSDIIKRLNKNLNNDAPEFYDIPENRELAAQYHLLYEISLPYGLDLNDRVDIDKSATRVTATLGNYSTGEVREFLVRSENWLSQNTPEYMHAKPTGATVMFSFISLRNIHSMLRGNVVAIIVISIILMIALKSFGLGVLSLIPNAAPIAMTFGLWAITFGNIGMAAASVSAVALGIVVDDTVHFLSKYLRARREQGLDKPEAIRYAFRTVGIALVVTTIILTIGFLVMATSAFQINEQLGLMTAATMVVALIIDFTLLPGLLLLGHNDKSSKKGAKNDESFVQAAE